MRKQGEVDADIHGTADCGRRPAEAARTFLYVGLNARF